MKPITKMLPYKKIFDYIENAAHPNLHMTQESENEAFTTYIQFGKGC